MWLYTGAEPARATVQESKYNMNWKERTERIIGTEAVKKLADCAVAVFGLGGVGSFAVEALARAGIGRFLLVDADTVEESNLNRQLVALRSTLGKPKTEVMAARIADINPDAIIETRQLFYLPETAADFDFTVFNYVVDAVDTVAAKLDLAERAHRDGVPIISCMGAGNKLDPTAFRVADIQDTKVDPLCRILRKKLRERGIPHLRVVYSEEPPISPQGETVAMSDRRRRATPGSVSFVPSVAGLILAGEVIRALVGKG